MITPSDTWIILSHLKIIWFSYQFDTPKGSDVFLPILTKGILFVTIKDFFSMCQGFQLLFQVSSGHCPQILFIPRLLTLVSPCIETKRQTVFFSPADLSAICSYNSKYLCYLTYLLGANARSCRRGVHPLTDQVPDGHAASNPALNMQDVSHCHIHIRYCSLLFVQLVLVIL